MGRTGVLKSSWENALYNSGLSFFYAAAGADPDADLRNWHITFNNGEPYDDGSGNPLPAFADIRDELTTHHSSYYIDHSQAPAPLLISSGFTDDLFPADEAIRFYNRTRTEHPGADISLFFGSFGHQRGQNKADALTARSAAELAWFNYHVRGIGSAPFEGVTTYTQTCPNAAASGGPYTAGNWAALAPGEVRLQGLAPADHPADGRVVGDRGPVRPAHGRRRMRHQLRDGPGRHGDLPHRPRADRRLHADGIAHRGGRHHVAGLRFPDRGQAARRRHRAPTRRRWWPAACGGRRSRNTPQTQVFQLHPNGYKFADGHVAKLELLPKDSGTVAGNSYGRTSNNQANVTVENLELRLPVLESPDSLGGLVEDPVTKFVPPGYTLAPGYPPPGYPRPAGRDAVAGVAGARLPGVHGARPRRTARRWRSRRAPRRSRSRAS